MLEPEQINQLVSAISDIDKEEVDKLYPRIVNLIANKLSALYVELYFVNSSKNLALPCAGSGEIGKIFAKHNRNCYLKVHNEFTAQIGPVIVLRTVSLDGSRKLSSSFLESRTWRRKTRNLPANSIFQ